MKRVSKKTVATISSDEDKVLLAPLESSSESDYDLSDIEMVKRIGSGKYVGKIPTSQIYCPTDGAR